MTRRLFRPAPDRQSQTIRRQRFTIAVAVGCALLSSAGLASTRLVKSPAQVQADASAPRPSVITAEVTSQVLATTLIFRGTVGSVSRIEVTPAASTASNAAAVIVSGVRVAAGDTIRAGQVLLEISGRPLIALPGAVPAYRDVKPGDSGPDVKQLQAALASLGYFGGKPDGQFGPATKSAITKLYNAIGYDTPTTGGPQDRGDRAALQSAHAAVVAAQQALTQNGQQPDLVQALNKAVADENDLIAHTGPDLPIAEVAFVPTFPAQVTALGARLGGAAAAPLITLSTGDLSVTADLDPAQTKLLTAGAAATVDSELLGTSATAKVSSIGPLTTQAAAGDSADQTKPGSPYQAVTITPDQPLPANWNGQDVRVTVTFAKTDAAVLAVPVAAVTARADGRTVVTVVDGDGTSTEVSVRAGVSADGLVQVTPVDGKLAAGDSVSVGQ